MSRNAVNPAGLYIHIPFCLKKCAYCDFLSFEHYGKDMRLQYVDSLIEEIQIYRGKRISIDTIFIGGGTPTILEEGLIAKIIAAVRAAFFVSDDAEITMEANPKTLSAEKLSEYRDAGVNRLSIGAQALDDTLLQKLGRIHRAGDFLHNYELARKRGFQNINIDLMFGIPGQTMELWLDTLRSAIARRPEHISFYSLQLEEGTPFYRQYKAGELDLMSMEEDRRMYHAAIRLLKEAGYEHYEISNCALPGFKCRHNLKYWSFDEYYGVGLGAHSFRYEHGRTCNLEDMAAYQAAAADGRLPVDWKRYQVQSIDDAMGEYMFTGLRKLDGVDTGHFYEMFKRDFYKTYQAQMEEIFAYKKRGYLTLDGAKLALTEEGIDHSNEIMAEFV